MILLLIILCLLINGCPCLPDGAPISACSSQMPIHNGNTAQTSKPPYEIHAEVYNQKIIVHVSSPVGKKFDGFILQARSSADPSKFIDGQFSAGQRFKTIDCFNGKQNTITHVNTNPKVQIVVEWVPRGSVNEEIIFRGTIAKSFDVFWDKIDSNPIRLINGSVYENTLLKEFVYESCFKTEGCLGLPDSCEKRRDCEVLLKYSKSSDDIIFSLEGIIESFQYMAMALSEDAVMGKDSVTECIRDGTIVISRESWNEGKSNTRTRVTAEDSYISSFIDGMTSCLWKTPLFNEENGEIYDFENKTFYLLLAKGNLSQGGLTYHDMRTASKEAINFTKYVSDEKDLDSRIDYDSHSSESQSPQTTTPHEMGSTTEESSSDEVITKVVDKNRSSYLKSSYMIFLLTGFLFAAKESLKDYIFM